MTKQPPGRVRSESSQRLLETLATMVRQQGSGASPPALTATTLCERADISRNALYRYHPDVVQALHAAQQKHSPRPACDRRAARQLRQDNADLREQLAKMASLVDHYFAAWQEMRLLLQRRDREVAELRSDAKTRVVSIAQRHRDSWPQRAHRRAKTLSPQPSRVIPRRASPLGPAPSTLPGRSRHRPSWSVPASARQSIRARSRPGAAPRASSS